MPEWMVPLAEVAGSWAEVLGRASLSGGVVLAIAWLAVRLFPRVPPLLRLWVWRLAVLKLLVALFWLAPVELPVLPASRAGSSLLASGTYRVAPDEVQPPEVRPGDAFPAVPSSAAGGPPRQPVSPVPLWLVAAWAVGVLASAVRVGRDIRGADRLWKESAPADDPATRERLERLAFHLRVRRVPELRLTGAGSPLLLGVRRPAILLPAAISGSPDLDLVLAHELAHLKRGDLAWGWLAAAVHALFWFHPLVWVAGREWRLAQELAADELALTATGGAAERYGAMLLNVTLSSQPASSLGYAGVGISESPDLLRKRILAMKNLRTPSSGRYLAGAALLGTAAVIGLVPWRVTAHADAPAPKGRASTQRAASATTSSIAPRDAAPAAGGQARTGDAGRSRDAAVGDARLRDEIAELKRLIQAQEAQLARLRKELTASQHKIADEQASRLLQQSEAHLRQLAKRLQAERAAPVRPSAAARVVAEPAPTDGLVQAENMIRARLLQEQARLRDLEMVYADRAPQVQEAQQRIKVLETELAELRARRREMLPALAELKALRDRQAKFEAEERALRQEILQLRVQLSFAQAELAEPLPNPEERERAKAKVRSLERVIQDLSTQAEAAADRAEAVRRQVEKTALTIGVAY